MTEIWLSLTNVGVRILCQTAVGWTVEQPLGVSSPLTRHLMPTIPLILRRYCISFLDRARARLDFKGQVHLAFEVDVGISGCSVSVITMSASFFLPERFNCSAGSSRAPWCVKASDFLKEPTSVLRKRWSSSSWRSAYMYTSPLRSQCLSIEGKGFWPFVVSLLVWHKSQNTSLRIFYSTLNCPPLTFFSTCSLYS